MPIAPPPPSSPGVPPAPPPVLEYGLADEPSAGPLPSGWRLAFFLISLAAAASPFLPFTFDTSPLDVWANFDRGSRLFWDDELLVIAAPFFAGLPWAAWQLRRLARPSLRRPERIVMYAIGAACAGLTTFAAARVLWGDRSQPDEVARLLLGPTVLVAWAGLSVWFGRRGRRDDAAMAALAGGYAGNAAMLLAVIFSPEYVGWWATLAAVAGIAVEAAVTAARAARRR